MIDALAIYIEHAFTVVIALILTGFALLLVVCVGAMIHAIYKGATDETWR